MRPSMADPSFERVSIAEHRVSKSMWRAGMRLREEQGGAEAHVGQDENDEERRTVAERGERGPIVAALVRLADGDHLDAAHPEVGQEPAAGQEEVEERRVGEAHRAQ